MKRSAYALILAIALAVSAAQSAVVAVYPAAYSRQPSATDTRWYIYDSPGSMKIIGIGHTEDDAWANAQARLGR